VIRDTSVGFWRRMHLIPFTQSFIEQPNLQLKDALRAEGPGILARAVRGCLAWQCDGLNPPASVREATKAYKNESEPLTRFFDTHCVFSDKAKTAFGDLWNKYGDWCKETREFHRMTRPEFIAALHARFTTDPNNKRNTVFIGVGLIDAHLREPEEATDLRM
jgi:putative DNA primase/helicase